MTRRPYTRQQRPNDAKRAQALQILTMREDISALTAGDLSRWTGLGEPECAALLAQAVLRRGL